MAEKNINTLDTSKKILPFAIGGILVLIFLLGLVLTLNQKDKAIQVDPSSLPAYPNAQPQIFLNNNSSQFGALAVTAKIEGVNVTIDEKEVSDPEFFPFSNTAPFVVSKIPTGIHTLRAKKEGYLTTTLTVKIESGQLATADIPISPNPDFGNLKKAEIKMPIKTPEYTIEYLNFIGVVQVNVFSAPYEENKQKAIEWFADQGVSNPEAQGVQFNDLTEIYVPKSN